MRKTFLNATESHHYSQSRLSFQGFQDSRITFGLVCSTADKPECANACRTAEDNHASERCCCQRDNHCLILSLLSCSSHNAAPSNDGPGSAKGKRRAGANDVIPSTPAAVQINEEQMDAVRQSLVMAQRIWGADPNSHSPLGPGSPPNLFVNLAGRDAHCVHYDNTVQDDPHGPQNAHRQHLHSRGRRDVGVDLDTLTRSPSPIKDR